jgi:adenylate cyclase
VRHYDEPRWDSRRGAAVVTERVTLHGLPVVKGRTQPVEMYEVMGFTADLSAESAGCIEIYSTGIERYLARDWDGAASAFSRSASLEPFRPGLQPGVHENPSLVMIGRCAEMKAAPPGDDWDGRHVMKTK